MSFWELNPSSQVVLSAPYLKNASQNKEGEERQIYEGKLPAKAAGNTERHEDKGNSLNDNTKLCPWNFLQWRRISSQTGGQHTGLIFVSIKPRNLLESKTMH